MIQSSIFHISHASFVITVLCALLDTGYTRVVPALPFVVSCFETSHPPAVAKEIIILLMTE